MSPPFLFGEKPDRSTKLSRFSQGTGVNRPDAPAGEEPMRERDSAPVKN
jgi:hypothetical protein